MVRKSPEEPDIFDIEEEMKKFREGFAYKPMTPLEKLQAMPDILLRMSYCLQKQVAILHKFLKDSGKGGNKCRRKSLVKK